MKKLIRKIENLEKKLANARVAILFNKTCLNENILPKFTNIYIYIYTHLCAQTVVGQRLAGNGPNGLSYYSYYN